MFRSASITALLRVQRVAFERIAVLYAQGHAVEARERLVFLERFLLHALSLCQAMQAKVGEALPDLNEDAIAEFARELGTLPEVPEPPL